jgi:Pyruvate-formate lyase-activating enzyme
MSEGILFDVGRGSVSDGPGLRTTFFLKGCPLRCRWCHNPESWSSSPCLETDYHDETERRRYRGFSMSAGDALTLALRDRAFYERSGGGITLSGGEPTAQPEFCAELVAAAETAGLGSCVETSGHCDPAVLLELARHRCLFLYDLKATGARLHEELTGARPELILDNLDRLCAAGASIVLRCPLVPRVNDSAEHLEHIARLARSYPRISVELLPYHDLGLSKYEKAGLERPRLDTFVPDAAYTAIWLERLKSAGVAATIG